MIDEYTSPVCPPCRLAAALLAEITPTSTVIDLGCGMGGYIPELYGRVARFGALVLVDAHEPYLAKVVAPPSVVKVRGVLPEVLSLFQSDLFDVAMACDVPEHLAPLDAMRLLSEMRRIARKVIVFVPEGHHPQDKDAYQLGADHWQTHRSTWTLGKPISPISQPMLRVADGSDTCLVGFSRVERWEDFHLGVAHEGKSPGALFCVQDL